MLFPKEEFKKIGYADIIKGDTIAIAIDNGPSCGIRFTNMYIFDIVQEPYTDHKGFIFHGTMVDDKTSVEVKVPAFSIKFIERRLRIQHVKSNVVVFRVVEESIDRHNLQFKFKRFLYVDYKLAY